MQCVNEPNAYFHWKVAYNSSKMLLFLVNDILDYSQIEAGKLKLSFSSFSPPDVVQSVVSLLQLQAERKGIELNVEHEEYFFSRFISDENRFKQVIINLVSNAIKFTF